MFQDHLIPKDSRIEGFYASQVKEPLEFYNSHYDVKKLKHRHISLTFSSQLIELSKTYEIHKDFIEVTYKILPSVDAYFGIELNIGIHAKREELIPHRGAPHSTPSRVLHGVGWCHRARSEQPSIYQLCESNRKHLSLRDY